ncbi:hypothetical protein J6590_000710 [Homalodisca vitripennis]|nr:hypothetical protein J6590_000710 [Homalodisca vitripennis]
MISLLRDDAPAVPGHAAVRTDSARPTRPTTHNCIEGDAVCTTGDGSDPSQLSTHTRHSECDRRVWREPDSHGPLVGEYLGVDRGAIAALQVRRMIRSSCSGEETPSPWTLHDILKSSRHRFGLADPESFWEAWRPLWRRYRSRGLSSTHSIAASPPTVLCGRQYAAHTRRKLQGGSSSSTAAALRSRQQIFSSRADSLMVNTSPHRA